VRGRRGVFAGLMDFIIMVKGTSNMFICGPGGDPGGTGQKCTMDEIGSRPWRTRR
jgi:acetyl-CoA carboxylase carboxyltransferase component